MIADACMIGVFQRGVGHRQDEIGGLVRNDFMSTTIVTMRVLERGIMGLRSHQQVIVVVVYRMCSGSCVSFLAAVPGRIVTMPLSVREYRKSLIFQAIEYISLARSLQIRLISESSG